MLGKDEHHEDTRDWLGGERFGPLLILLQCTASGLFQLLRRQAPVARSLFRSQVLGLLIARCPRRVCTWY